MSEPAAVNQALTIARPEPGEYAPYYDRYIALVAGADILSTLDAQRRQMLLLLSGRDESDGDFRYAPDKWNAIIAINLSAAFHTTRLAVPEMKRKGWGRIINTASAHSLVASPNKSAYVAAKHGIAGFTKTVALETATSGITVNCISPGYVWTPLVEHQIPDTMKARNMTREQVMNDVLLAAQPTKRFVTPEEVAALALYLCREEARSITGANLSIDGGWTAA